MRFSLPQFSLFQAVIAAAALAAVFIGQYGFGLHPCHLCLYQRWPFAAIIVLGIFGYVMPRYARAAVACSTLAFLIDCAIGVYHSGVERKYWAGLEGCSSPDMSGSIEELMARIQSAAVTRCDEIEWSLMGISLANMNVVLCAGMFALSVYVLLKSRSQAQA